MSSFHALHDSSSADVATTLSQSSVAMAVMYSRSALVVLQVNFNLVPLVADGSRLNNRVSLVGPLPYPKWAFFDVIDKRLGAWGREAQLIIFILAGGSFSLPPLMRMKALYLTSLMSKVVQQTDTRR